MRKLRPVTLRKKGPRAKWNVARAVVLREQGHTWNEIAKAVRAVSGGAVSSCLRGHKLVRLQPQAKKIDLKGQRFGQLVVLRDSGKRTKQSRATIWLCRCDCGKKYEVWGNSLRKGNATRCLSCARRSSVTIHGLSKTYEYTQYLVIRTRCFRSVAKTKIGIFVGWCGAKGFDRFLRDMGQCPKGSVFGRRNPHGPYTPENCAWIKPSERVHGNTKHGMDDTPTMRSYRSMLSRCFNPKVGSWNDYGRRGITVCKRWLGERGFFNFLADMGERPEEKTLDRINNDGNYEPMNCRWATAKQQANNRRPAVREIVEHDDAVAVDAGFGDGE